jgi:hypothetical protein
MFRTGISHRQTGHWLEINMPLEEKIGDKEEET